MAETVVSIKITHHITLITCEISKRKFHVVPGCFHSCQTSAMDFIPYISSWCRIGSF